MWSSAEVAYLAFSSFLKHCVEYLRKCQAQCWIGGEKTATATSCSSRDSGTNYMLPKEFALTLTLHLKSRNSHRDMPACQPVQILNVYFCLSFKFQHIPFQLRHRWELKGNISCHQYQHWVELLVYPERKSGTRADHTHMSNIHKCCKIQIESSVLCPAAQMPL